MPTSKVKFLSVLIFCHLTQGISGIFEIRSIGINALYLLTWISILFHVKHFNLGTKRMRFDWVGPFLIITGLVLSSIYNGSRLLDVTQYANYLSVFLVICLVMKESLLSILNVLTYALIFHIATGVIEIVLGQTFFYSRWKNVAAIYVGSFIRPASTIGDPNYLALALLILSICIIYISRLAEIDKVRYRLAAFSGIIFIFLTFSRAGIIAVTCLGVLSALKKSKNRVTRIAMLLFSTALIPIVVPYVIGPFTEALSIRFSGLVEADASLKSRIAFQTLGSELIRQNPLFGIGPRNFELKSQILLNSSRPLNLQTQVLNTFLEAYLVGGFLTFVGLLVVLIRNRMQSNQVLRVPLEFFVPIVIILCTLDTLQFGFLWLALSLFSIRFKEDVND